MKFLYYFAITGFILGLIVHIVALAGINIADSFPFIWLLHVGIFVVWIPVVLKFNKNEEYRQLRINKNKNPFKLYALLFRSMPKYIAALSIFFFFYAIVNFMLFMAATEGGGPEFVDGKYILESHGTFIRELTETEFIKMKANIVRGFSGHWMAFYSLSIGLLWTKDEGNDNTKFKNI